MNNVNQQILILLTQLEDTLQHCQLRQVQPPDADAFLSHEPFAVDTMLAHEWLQWIFIPKMRALIDAHNLNANITVPRNFSLYPYFAEAFKTQQQQSDLLKLIQQLDDVAKTM